MKITLVLLTTIAATLCVSCDDTNSKELQRKIEEKLHSTLDDISRSSTPPLEEVKKLSQLEYHMEVFPLESDSDEVINTLNNLGKDRWECFSSFARPRTEPQKPEMVVLCKRMPETVLRHLPGSFIGK